MFGSGGGDIASLSGLLDESRKAQEQSENRTSQPPIQAAPTNIVQGKKEDKAGAAKNSTAIWDDAEILKEDEFFDKDDKRLVPKYEFFYKQSVGTEDTFLGMSDKTPLSSDCTHLVVKVHFPGCTMKELDLDVTKNRIKVSSKKYRLFTYLPVNVDDANGNAKFDSKKEVLIVTLPIIQEW